MGLHGPKLSWIVFALTRTPAVQTERYMRLNKPNRHEYERTQRPKKRGKNPLARLRRKRALSSASVNSQHAASVVLCIVQLLALQFGPPPPTSPACCLITYRSSSGCLVMQDDVAVVIFFDKQQCKSQSCDVQTDIETRCQHV